MSVKKDNFKRISENRVSKILTLFEQMNNLTNTSYYEYSEEDIEKIFKTLEEELIKTKMTLLNNKKKNKRFEL